VQAQQCTPELLMQVLSLAAVKAPALTSVTVDLQLVDADLNACLARLSQITSLCMTGWWFPEVGVCEPIQHLQGSQARQLPSYPYIQTLVDISMDKQL